MLTDGYEERFKNMVLQLGYSGSIIPGSILHEAIINFVSNEVYLATTQLEAKIIELKRRG